MAKEPKEKTKGKRKRRIIILLVIALLFVVFGLGSVEVTSLPAFCNTCHSMKPYVANWKASAHKDVTCVECHFAPGLEPWMYGKINGISQVIKTITNSHAARPEAQIEDASCLREGCHTKEGLPRDLLFAGKYKFSHEPHLVELTGTGRLRCVTCHSHVMEDAHMITSQTVCITCHFKGVVAGKGLTPVGGCTACHEVPEEITLANGSRFVHEEFIGRGAECWMCHSDSVAGTGEVPKQICVQCHDETARVAAYDDPDRVHKGHVAERKVECLRCHQEIQHSQQPHPIASAGGCGVCHPGGHDLPAAMFAGRGAAGDVAEMPSMHQTANVDCVACHEVPVTTASFGKANETSCIVCHGPSIEGTLAGWHDAIDETLKEAKAGIAAALEELSLLPAGDEAVLKAGSFLRNSQENLRFVELGRGVHNPEYALEIMDKASGDTASAARLLKEVRKRQTAPDAADE